MLKRIFAVLTTLLLATGLTVGVASAASAHDANYNVDCSGLNLTFVKYGASTTNYVTVTVDNVVVANHLLFNDSFTASYPMTSTSSHSYKIEIDAQGTTYDKLGDKAITGTWIPCASTGLTCDVATLYKGSALSNGDHINMDVEHNGSKFQVNAYVDQRQAQDPASESGLVLRIHLDSGDTVLALTNAQKASGILAFSYSTTWTGTWTIEWVQYNSSYFNQNRDTTKFMHCAKDIPLVISVVPSATQPTCSVDGKLIVPTTANITWSGGTDGAGPGTYNVKATPAAGYTLNGAQDTWIVQVLPKGTGLNCGPPPCIAASQVSYTYDAATNSGTVTVPNPAGSSGKLCDGFWVTAVSWKYAGNAVWPQNLDKNNPMPEKNGSFFVDEPGTYNYAATVACGQGDIYASYDAQPVPTAFLNGPNNPYAEHFLHDMGFSGPSPTYMQSPIGCNQATPVAPVAKSIIACGTNGTLTYGPTTGVVYSLTVGNGTSGLWEVTATPATNYYFAGAQAVKFTGDLGTHTDCTLATKPVLTPPVCNTTTGIVTSAYVTIPTTPGVSYRIDGTKYPAGTKVDLGVGAHVGTAETEAGWTNTGDSSWNLDVAALADCDDPVEYVAPVITPEICDAPTGDIKGASILFEDVEFLNYELDGTPIVFPAGQTTVSVPVTAGAHTITVTTDSGYYIKGTNLLTEKDYPVTIDTPATCDDPVKYVTPDVDTETCDVVAGGVKDGAVTFTTVPAHLTYVFDNVTVDATHLVFERPAGTYNLVVTAESGYYITGGGTTATYPITIADPGKDCDEITKIPTDPFPTHEECVADSPTDAKTPGSITIVKAEHVTWQISSDLDGVKHAVDTSGIGPNFVFPYPAGSYHVWATADPGYFITTPTSFPITINPPSKKCGLDTLAFLPTGATWTNQVCAPSGLVQPTISVQQFPGVTYFIDGIAVPKSTTTTTVKPGTYLITAAADDPIADTVSQSTWPPVLLTAAAAGVCGDLTTLAFTGAAPGGWLILAIVLLQAGLALIAIRFVRRRRAARHLTV